MNITLINSSDDPCYDSQLPINKVSKMNISLHSLGTNYTCMKINDLVMTGKLFSCKTYRLEQSGIKCVKVVCLPFEKPSMQVTGQQWLALGKATEIQVL